MTTLNTLYQDLRKTFRDSGIETADLDARVLISFALGCATQDILLKPDTSVDENHPVLKDAIARRLKGEPVSKITGHREFYELDFIVSQDVLDPRADSETLIDAARKNLFDIPEPKILDICTGSGCLLLTLLTLFPGGEGVGTDISEAALKIAQKNARRLNVDDRARFIPTSFVDNVKGAFDCIVCNPPYIRSGDIEGLDVAVRVYDPLLALDGGADGLDAYRAIFPQIRNLLSRDGEAFFEIGFDQEDDVRKLAESCGLHVRDVLSDLSGHGRVVALS